MMRVSVRQAMITAIEDYPQRKRPEWAVGHPGQVVLNGSQVVWTGDVESAMKKNEVKEYWEKLN